MSLLAGIVLWIHVVAAVTWVGGTILIALIGPRIRSLEPDVSESVRKLIARRFRDMSWVSVGVLIITGIINLTFWTSLSELPGLLQTDPMLQLKIVLVIVMIIVKGLHDFVVGPRATGNRRHTALWWKGAMFLGRLNLILGLTVLYVAVRLGGR